MADVGRPTDYNPNIHPKAAYTLAKMGLTNTKIAEGMGIATSTFHKWRDEYEAFSDAVKKGKDSADDLVEESLFKRAIGEYVKETKTKDDGHSVTIETTEKHVADTTAMIFWLKNRRPKEWRDKRETEISGPDGEALTINLIRAKHCKDE